MKILKIRYNKCTYPAENEYFMNSQSISFTFHFHKELWSFLDFFCQFLNFH